MATLARESKCSVYGGKTVVIEGHKGIVDYSADKLTFASPHGFIIVNGEGLRIRHLEKNFAVIVGKIISLEVNNGK